MTDTQTAPATATLKLSDASVQSILDSWRGAGGVSYSSPKGMICAMAQPKLLAFLAEFLLAADRSAPDRAEPDQDLRTRLDQVETALFRLVKAVCPGLDHNDLLADAGIALAAMASAEPAGHFAIDDEPATDGSARYLHIGAEHAADEDVFPLYRRAPTLAEVHALADVHQVAPAGNSNTTGVSAASLKAPSKKAASK